MDDEFVKWCTVHSVFHRVYMKCEADKVKVENVGDGKRLVALSLENLPDVGRCKHSFPETIAQMSLFVRIKAI